MRCANGGFKWSNQDNNTLPYRRRIFPRKLWAGRFCCHTLVRMCQKMDKERQPSSGGVAEPRRCLAISLSPPALHFIFIAHTGRVQHSHCLSICSRMMSQEHFKASCLDRAFLRGGPILYGVPVCPRSAGRACSYYSQSQSHEQKCKNHPYIAHQKHIFNTNQQSSHTRAYIGFTRGAEDGDSSMILVYSSSTAIDFFESLATRLLLLCRRKHSRTKKKNTHTLMRSARRLPTIFVTFQKTP